LVVRALRQLAGDQELRHLLAMLLDVP